MPSKAAQNTKPKADTTQKVSSHPLFETKQRSFNLSYAVGKKLNLTRMVRWPRYVRIQRHRKILMSRFKVPPAINQFTKTLDKDTATSLFKLLHKYRPETEQQKEERLKKTAEAKESKKETKESKPKVIKYGINNVTTLIEKKKAKLVVIAHDVDPIELVVWLPALCRRMEVPYCIVKSKSRLGALVHQKTATCLALVDVNKEDVNELTHLATTCNDTFNNNADLRKMWGGGQLSNRSNAALRKRERAIAREAAAKTKAQ